MLKFLLVTVAALPGLTVLSCKSKQVEVSQQDQVIEPDNSFFLERDKWEKADKSNLEALNNLKNSFTNDQMSERASDYIYGELDTEIRRRARQRGIPAKYHELKICTHVLSCKDLMLYEVFRKFALSYIHMVSRGFSDMKATANNREIVVKLSTNDGPVQFYFRSFISPRSFGFFSLTVIFFRTTSLYGSAASISTL